MGVQLEVDHLAHRAADIRDSQAEATKLLALFPNLRAVGLREGLRQTVEWFGSSRGSVG